MKQATQEHSPLEAKLAWLGLFFLALAVCGWWSLHYALGPYGFSILWIPNGILFGFLLTTPRSRWPGFIVCAFAALLLVNVQRNELGWLSLLLSLANIFETWLAASLLLTRVSDVSYMASIKRTTYVGGLATLLACAVSALFAASAIQLLTPQRYHFGVLYETWFASHALGMVIFGTLAVIVRTEGWGMLGAPKRRIELAATLGLIAFVAWFVFSKNTVPTAFILIPLLLVCVLRHRFSGFVPAMTLIALITTMKTMVGTGPFITIAGVDNAVRSLQLYLFVCCWSAFPVASALTQYKLLSRNLLRSKALYKTLAEYSRDLILRIRPDRSFDYISPSVTELLGWTPEEFERIRWELTHPEDVDVLRDAIFPLYKKEGVSSAVYRCKHEQGHYVWLAANMRSVPDERGELMLVYSARDVTSRIEAEQALEMQVRRDPLTGLANRRLLDERLVLALARAKRNKAHVGLLYCDIDHFKTINDTYGHAAGDLILREFSRRLNCCIRSVDLAVRLGGDEFVILVEDIVSSQGLQYIANKLVVVMSEPVRLEGATINMSTSIGIGLSGPSHQDAASLLQLADSALYQAKAAGRNTWKLAESGDASVS